MKVEDSKGWLQVTKRQLQRQLQKSPQPQLAPLVERYQGNTVSGLIGEVFERGEKSVERSMLSGLAGAGALLGGLTAYLQPSLLGGLNLPGLAPALMAGAGLAGLATAWNFHQMRGSRRCQQQLTGLARDCYAGLLQPGPSPDTYLDQRGFEAGTFHNLQSLKSKADDQCISRHAELKTPVPVVFDEDCQRGTVTIRSGDQARTYLASMTLPTVQDPVLHVCLKTRTLPGKATFLGQDFHADGQSEVTADSPTLTRSLIRVSVTQAPLAWEDGTLICIGPSHYNSFFGRDQRSEQLLARPLVLGEELGVARGSVPAGQLRYDLQADGWQYANEPGVELNRGEAAAVFLPVTADGFGYTPAPGVSLDYRWKDRLVQVKLPDGRQHTLPGHLDRGQRALDYEVGPTRLRQTFGQERLQLEAFLPEGRVLLHHQSGAEPQARLFWGSEPHQELQVKSDSQGYLVGTEQGEQRLTPAVPLQFLASRPSAE
ncbi:MAG: hypothetical protein U0931_24515 [Vulcanimicrobiota bacterium]